MPDALQRSVRSARLLLLSVLLALAALAVSGGAAAATASALEAFVAEVLERNPSLRAGARRTAAFRHEASAADLWPDPALSVMVDRVPGHEGGEMPMVQYQLSQMIPWPGKLGLMRDAIERQGDAAAAQLEMRRLDLALEARRGYLMLLLNARLREINAASRGLADTIAAAALSRYATGAGGHHEVARAQVEQAALEVEALNLAGERVSALAMLNALRDRPPATTLPDPPAGIETPFGRASLAALMDRATRDRPELKAMAAMQREARAMGDLAKRERYPDLMASVWYNQMLGGPDTAGVMLGVTLPLFGVQRQDRRAAAWGSRAAAAGDEAAAMRAMIRAQVAEAYQQAATAARVLDLLRKMALPRAQQSLESALAAYATGALDLTAVLDARRALQSAERAIAAAAVRRELSLAALRRAVGGTIEEEP
jgi:outer membrane protein TolC